MKDLTKSKVTREADKKVNSLGTIFWAAPEVIRTFHLPITFLKLTGSI